MKHIFEGNWVYLAHESQIANVNDYLTDHIGRQPVVITRSRTASSTRWPTPARTAAPSCAATRRATSRASPARSTAGPSTTAGKLLKVKDTEPTPATRRASTAKAATT